MAARSRRPRCARGTLCTLAWCAALFALPQWSAVAIAPAHADDADAPRRRGLRIAVIDLDAGTVDARLARVVTESLVAELRKLERVSVISYDEVRAMLSLEADKQLAGCDEAESCLAEIADAIGADNLITGTLARVGGDHVMGFKRIAQAEARAVGGFNKRVPAGNGEEFLAEIGPAVAELFPDVALREGQVRGVSKEAARRLSPPPLPPWVLPAGLATSGVVLVAACGAALLQALSQQEYTALAEESAQHVVGGRSLVAAGGRAQTAELAGWVLLATGLSTGAATLVALPFIDFAGDADAGIGRAAPGATP
ncbi:MAG: hypothetical protein IT383_23390 [Deltaproteobacteria bacterium]|nr:hypothetical protein [Deltaproteobacteria bacterium]